MIIRIGEFIDAMYAFKRGCILVVLPNGLAMMDGARIFYSLPVLLEHKLLQEITLENQQSFLTCFVLNDQGKKFAKEAIQKWEEFSLPKRLFFRFAR